MSRNLIKQITKAYDYQSSIEALRNQPFQMPLDLTSPMLEYMMERSYLDDMDKRQDFISTRIPGQRNKPISWIKINRIPVHPSQAENYDLITKWQACSLIDSAGISPYIRQSRRGGRKLRWM